MSDNSSTPSEPDDDEQTRPVEGVPGSPEAPAPNGSTSQNGALSTAIAAQLGAQTAFRLDPKTLAAFSASVQRSTALPPEVLTNVRASAQAVVNALNAQTGANARSPVTLEAFNAFQRYFSANLENAFPEDYFDQLRETARLLAESVSIPALYSSRQLASRRQNIEPAVRSSHSAEAFFDEHVVEINDVPTLLKFFSTVQQKHREHMLVWRGQQNAKWPTHSSLYRKLETTAPPSEEDLIEAERTSMDLAVSWGRRPNHALEFLADLQHFGAPTRLLDVTLEPEMAAWFAVEADPELDDVDGRVVAWGRLVRISKTSMSAATGKLPPSDDLPFWHGWTNENERSRVGWGTGSRTWDWFPPALSDRMRAQRAGFLLEAAPLVTAEVADVISEGTAKDWRAEEIAHSTSIVGIPSRYDVRTKKNGANLVPIFSARISCHAKEELRDYLASKGFTSQSVYPDFGGLVQYLRGPIALH
ncbi:FRG domain-containing protein [Rathayibacter sp. ZW T2_19]|uniref:FRG domain-containing protein n=1 Tax=Rathayibacter rubneri TaxID=2950106 RepID=A0A9X2E0P1_9MICO|nr:FRG domain-containing protein [Rathayibacter rubneri]MCM6763746.1 FRG domain-containing protein [Rathayibacter rubneri]